MKFLVDAQLPKRLAEWLNSVGSAAVHTLDLPEGNRTTDTQITSYADQEQMIVVSKDADFVNSHLLHGRPVRLLLISTGNTSNRELESLLVPQLPDILREFESCTFIELGREGIVIRG